MLTSPSRTLRNVGSDAAFLCYHSIAPDGPPFLSLTPERFREHLGVLRARRWTTGGETELAELAAGRRASRPTAFLTFDDGYLDTYEQAFPLLREFGMRAFVFILPQRVDDGGELRWDGVEGDCDRYPQVMRSMTWPMAEEMAAHGVVIGSHTLSHPHLDRIGDEQLRDELVDSRRQIADRLGSCDSLAYPYGHWDARVHAAARAAGYSWAFTIPRAGQATADALSIPRIPVDHRDDARRFGAKLHAPVRALLLSHTAGSAARRARDAAVALQRRVPGSTR